MTRADYESLIALTIKNNPEATREGIAHMLWELCGVAEPTTDEPVPDLPSPSARALA